MSRVLIAGCGYLGAALGRRLAGADLSGTDLSGTGHEVWGLRRGPSGADSSGAGVSGADPSGAGAPESFLSETNPSEVGLSKTNLSETNLSDAGLSGSEFTENFAPFIADLCDPESLEDLPPDLDFVFYTAAADEAAETAYRSAYLTGLENTLDALSNQNQNLKRFFFASSTAVYAQSAGEWVDEDSPAEAAHFRGRIMREAEEMALGGPYPATVVRFGGIYGPGRTRLIEEARRWSLETPRRTLEAAGPVETGDGPSGEAGPYVNRIHREDCAGVFHHLMGMSAPASLYLGVDREPAGKCEVLRWLGEQLPPGGAAPEEPVPEGAGASDHGDIPPIPDGPQEAAAISDDRDFRLGGRGKRCSSARLRSAGYTFIHPTFREGYGAILAGEGG
ncbi:MAG: NAD-dependent epimerase/dehydratase family protein [Nitrospinota bacterium]|nr:NAD-dependent epimerase/dehydratase family protein [Nitrospinota bacterium]